jgi:hypothetical protein
MSQIPTQVKIKGQWKNVIVSGRGYVKVGSVEVNGRSFYSEDAWEELKQGPEEAWRAMLTKCYEKALREARREADREFARPKRR